MIIAENIEYNYWQFLYNLGIFKGVEVADDYSFSIDSFDEEVKDNCVCVETSVVGGKGDQGNSIKVLKLNIKVRSKLKHEAKEQSFSLYENKDAFGFGKLLPAYDNGDGFVVPEKKTSNIQESNGPVLLETDQNGLFIYIMSVDIYLSE